MEHIIFMILDALYRNWLNQYHCHTPPLEWNRKYGKLSFHNTATLTLILAPELVYLAWEDISMNLWPRMEPHEYFLFPWQLGSSQCQLRSPYISWKPFSARKPTIRTKLRQWRKTETPVQVNGIWARTSHLRRYPQTQSISLNQTLNQGVVSAVPELDWF